jgi:copper chaperone CopZ
VIFKKSDMKNSIILIISLLFTGVIYAQGSNVTLAKIQTSAECGHCKKRLEDKLNYTTGVKYAELTLVDKSLKVKYNKKKIAIDEIRRIISELGYDADHVKAVVSAVKKLPGCCQSGGMMKQIQ